MNKNIARNYWMIITSPENFGNNQRKRFQSAGTEGYS